ncbi:efflux RND transporter permease subunit [bacterium]|nr:efflux RND transporter permease subunit [bacterium]
MIAKLIEFSARNPFLVFLLTGIAVASGWYAFRAIPLDAIPDLSDPQVIVFTEWKGQSPGIMEDQVTYPIVSSLLAAPQAKTVRGFSFFGLSFVYVIFEDGTDIYWARSRVLEYLSKIQGSLPEGVNPTLGPDATGVGWVFEYALVDNTGQNDLADLRSFNDWTLKYALESVQGVAEVASVGGQVKQYQVQLDPDRLRGYGIPIQKVVMALRRSNNDVGGRILEFAGRDAMVRGLGYIKNLEDVRSIPVIASDGTPVRIGDLGVVSFGPQIRRGVADLNGEGEVVGGIVVMRYGENALKVIERVKDRLEEVHSSFPPGVELVTTYDRAELIKRSVDTLNHTLVEEAIVVFIVCLLFLFHTRSALVIILTLPIAVLLAFIPMMSQGLTANIMSLGGIAIAIGVMVDAAIILVENAHKRLEVWEKEGSPGGAVQRKEVIIEAAKEVGPSLFFALLVITVSFLPIFTLEAQEGRLFKPLAYTKTYAMAFSALLAVTVTPPLMVLLLKGKILPEKKNPFNRVLAAIYSPLAKWALKSKYLVLVLAIVAVASAFPIFKGLGSEFMPPLNEGTILYMPTTIPGISVGEALASMRAQDRLIKEIPEVAMVFGKAGRARTSTDPAPLSMVETVITLKPESEWRQVKRPRFFSGWREGWVKSLLGKVWSESRPITWEEIIEDLEAKVNLPGWTNAWVFPIRTRIDMLTTGIRTPVGIKIHGDDLEEIEMIGGHLEAILSPLEGTRSVFADRLTGGTYLDIEVDREAASRHGLTVGDVQDVIMTAVGGMDVTTTVEGRERYAINVRYMRELRSDPAALAQIYVPTPTGAQIPLGQLATIGFTKGPPAIKDEDGRLVGYVFVDVDLSRTDLGGYVARAKEVVEEKLIGAGLVPEGTFLTWSGQYESMERVTKRLQVVIPITLFVVFILLYTNTKSLASTHIILLSIPFALVGAFHLLSAMSFNLSIAVWVGIIALAGLAAEMGVVMLLYLETAYKKRKEEGQMTTLGDLENAAMEGSVQRVRPVAMTSTVTLVGLLPLMFSTGAGSDVMRRIAAPMVGGIITTTLMILLVFPSIFVVWKWWSEVRPRRGSTG